MNPQQSKPVRLHRVTVTMCLIALTFTTGMVDAATWASLENVFTANMTGNVLLIGLGAVGAGDAHWLPPLVSVVSFIIGAMAPGWLQRRAPEGWNVRTTAQFTFVGVVVLAIGLSVALFDLPLHGPTAWLLTVVLAMMMGVQASEALRLSVSHVITVAVSSSVVALGTGLSLAVLPAPEGRKMPTTVRSFLAILALGGGAAFGGLIMSHSFSMTLISAGAIILLVAFVGHFRVAYSGAEP